MTQVLLPDFAYAVGEVLADADPAPAAGWVRVRARLEPFGSRVFDLPAESVVPVPPEPDVPYVEVPGRVDDCPRVLRRRSGVPGEYQWGYGTWAHAVAGCVRDGRPLPRPLVYADSPDDTPAQYTRPWQPGNVR